MNEGICLRTVATWFPPDVVPTATLPDLPDLPSAHRELVAKLGIDEIRDAGELTEIDLAEQAAHSALTRAGLAASDLDGLILVQGRAPQYLMASEATRLQDRIGARDAFVTSVGDLGCVSSSAALSVGAGLLAAHPSWQTVLIAMGVRSPTAARFRHPMTVLGDGAQAVVLTRKGPGRFRMLDHALHSDGRYADLFRIRYRDVSEEDWLEECTDPNVYSFQLALESRKRFAELVRLVLDRTGTDPGMLGGYVLQNLSAGSLAFWSEALEAKFLAPCERNVREYGHVGPVDVLFNLDCAYNELRAGDRVLVLNSSPVAAWSCALFERLPDSEGS